jgi:hypothetical protein
MGIASGGSKTVQRWDVAPQVITVAQAAALFTQDFKSELLPDLLPDAE